MVFVHISFKSGAQSSMSNSPCIAMAVHHTTARGYFALSYIMEHSVYSVTNRDLTISHNHFPTDFNAFYSCTQRITRYYIQSDTLLLSRHTIVCRAAHEAGTPHHEYINRKKENMIFTPM